MNGTEKRAVKVVAKIAPWLAPIPSAYFVARSAMVHLDMPLVVAVIAAAIIETLGLSTVHSALWALEWNESKRQNDPSAPVSLTVALGAAYVVATVGLVVALEVAPWLSVYAPAIFPILAVVGAINLAFIARQESREAAQAADRAEKRRQREEKKAAVEISAGNPAGNADESAGTNGNGDGKGIGNWKAFMEAYPNMMDLSGDEIGKLAGVSGRTGRNWKRYAQEAGYGN